MKNRSENQCTTLQAKVAILKDQFGEKKVRHALRQFVASREPGRPKKWSQTRLFCLWFIVQCYVQLEDNITVNMSCEILEYLGGIFESFDHEAKVRNKLVSKKARIHRLYYDAEAAFGCLEAREATPAASCQDSTLREKLRSLAAEVAARGIFMCPVITVAEAVVLECMKSDDIPPKNILDDSCWSYVQIDLSEVKFVPDGKLWCVKGVRSQTENTN